MTEHVITKHLHEVQGHLDAAVINYYRANIEKALDQIAEAEKAIAALRYYVWNTTHTSGLPGTKLK